MSRGLHYLDEDSEDEYQSLERIQHRPKTKPSEQEQLDKIVDKKFRKQAKRVQELKGFE